MIACWTVKLRMKSSAETPIAAPGISPKLAPAMKTRLPFTVASVRAMSDELVTTVSLRCPRSSRARKLVVVPVSTMIASPSPMRAASAAGDGALGGGVLAHPTLERGLAKLARKAHRPMHPHRRSCVHQRADLAAHGFGRNAQLVRQRRHRQ